MRDRITLEIHIHNLTRAQVIAIEDMLATWQQLGLLGASRWTAFYADGDGDFRPTCVVNGHVARPQRLVPDGFWDKGGERHGEYRIDYDRIGWALRAEEERAQASVNMACEQAVPEKGNVIPMSDPKAETLRWILGEWEQQECGYVAPESAGRSRTHETCRGELTDLQSRSYAAGWEAGMEAAKQAILAHSLSLDSVSTRAELMRAAERLGALKAVPRG